MEEIWKPIKGYEGLYEVSNYGKIKSLNRKIKNKNNKIIILKEKILKPAPIKTGHLNVILSKNNIKKHCYVHRLVAEAFIKNPKKLPFINHKDENPKNNYVNNLEWCDAQYNNTYGTFIERRVKNTDFAKRSLTANKYQLKVVQLDLKNNIIEIYNSLTEASQKTNTQLSKICSCCKGKRKTSNGYKWQYYELDKVEDKKEGEE